MRGVLDEETKSDTLNAAIDDEATPDKHVEIIVVPKKKGAAMNGAPPTWIADGPVLLVRLCWSG